VSAHSFTPNDTFFDGLRLRQIGLAVGLKDNGIDPTIIFHSSTSLKFTKDGIRFESWNDIGEFANKLQSYKIVIFNYASMGLNELICGYLKDSQLLIADALVPIELENEHIGDIDINYLGCYKVLNRSDFFLVSNLELALYYMKIGKRNSLNNSNLYDIGRYLVCPFGLHANEAIKSKSEKYLKSKSLIWYGGAYPWFDLEALMNFVSDVGKFEEEFTLHLVGLESNHYENSKASKAINQIMEKARKTKNVHHLPWLPYSRRLEYLSRFDAAVFFNKEFSNETNFSWRTRYTDFVLSRLPLLVNFPDPFSEFLNENGCALVHRDLALAISSLNPFESFRDASWDKVINELSWPKVSQLLSSKISELLE
jgi:hypothetical protein